MLKTVYLALISICFTSPLFSQTIQKSQLMNLHLSWEILENNYKGINQTRSALTIRTSNQETLPSKGWKIYFNFARPIKEQPLTGGVSIKPINGDFFSIEPLPDFKGLKPGASLRTELVSGDWLVNATDAPAGFYLIRDNEPAKYYVLPSVEAIPSRQNKQIMRNATDHVPFKTPDLTFEENRKIKDLETKVKIFPTPAHYEETSAVFKLSSGTVVIADPAFQSESAHLKHFLTGLLNTGGKTGTSIHLNKKNLPEEAYELSVKNNSINIAASSPAGIFYGIQSLKTLLPPVAYKGKQTEILVPGVEVSDQARFGYRAFMLDVARNFQTKKQILKLLDLMALYKLNTLHFHLNDDEGWRLEIPALPELTTFGSKRGHTLDEKTHLQPSLGSGPAVEGSYGTGYYSKADFMDILKYATERHIQVIPEIESPGHARAAIKAMAARNDPDYLLHDPQDQSEYRSVQYWNDNVMNVALPSVYHFIETLTREIKSMYVEAGAPLKTIHYGGDEVPAGVWEKSPAVQALMKQDTTIKTTDDLWGYYYKKVDQILKAEGLYLSAWEEVATRKVVNNGQKETVFNEDMLGKNVHLDIWNNMIGWGQEDLAYKFANKGFQVVLSGVSNMYFDMAYEKSFDEPGYYWGGYIDVEKPFSFIPYNYYKNTTSDRMGNVLPPDFFDSKEKLSEKGMKNIVGLQAALFSEVSKGPERMEYLILPKLLGLAERAWAKDPEWAQEQDPKKSERLYQEAWSAFMNSIGKRELPRLDYYAGGFKYRIPGPGAVLHGGAIEANSQIPGFVIKYTTDGSQPNWKSKTYTGPVKEKGTIKMAVFNLAGRSGKTITIHQ